MEAMTRKMASLPAKSGSEPFALFLQRFDLKRDFKSDWIRSLTDDASLFLNFLRIDAKHLAECENYVDLTDGNGDQTADAEAENAGEHEQEIDQQESGDVDEVLIDDFLAEDHGPDDSHVEGMVLQEDRYREGENKHRIYSWNDAEEEPNCVNDHRKQDQEEERNIEQESVEEVVVFHLSVDVPSANLVANGDEYTNAQRKGEEVAQVWNEPDSDVEECEKGERQPVLLVDAP